MKANGINNTSPPAKIRHTIKIGNANAIRIVAMIFAVLHVIFRANPIVFINNQMLSAEMMSSINSCSSYKNLTSYPSKQLKKLMINSCT